MSDHKNSVGDTVAVLWRRENDRCPLSGEFQNRATDLLIPAGATLAVFPIENRQNERAPNYRVVVFPPKDTSAGNGTGLNADDLPF